jgi:hypothetical protein
METGKAMSGASTKARDEALSDGWLLIDMKNDWRTVFP